MWGTRGGCKETGKAEMELTILLMGFCRGRLMGGRANRRAGRGRQLSGLLAPFALAGFWTPIPCVSGRPVNQLGPVWHLGLAGKLGAEGRLLSLSPSAPTLSCFASRQALAQPGTTEWFAPPALAEFSPYEPVARGTVAMGTIRAVQRPSSRQTVAGDLIVRPSLPPPVPV